jgi:hypothetical protein
MGTADTTSNTRSRPKLRLESSVSEVYEPLQTFHFRRENFYRPTDSLRSYDICEFLSKSAKSVNTWETSFSFGEPVSNFSVKDF